MQIYKPIKRVSFVFFVALVLMGCQALYTTSPVSLENLRKIQIGSDKDQVRRVLGSPDNIDFYKRLNEEAWFYQHPDPSEGTFAISFKGTIYNPSKIWKTRSFFFCDKDDFIILQIIMQSVGPTYCESGCKNYWQYKKIFQCSHLYPLLLYGSDSGTVFQKF